MTPARQGVLRGEQVIQKRLVDCNWARGVGEGGKPRGCSRVDQLFGRPDVVGGGSCKEVSPVGGFSALDGFEVAELRLSHYVVGVGGLRLFGFPGGSSEFLPESG